MLNIKEIINKLSPEILDKLESIAYEDSDEIVMEFCYKSDDWYRIIRFTYFGNEFSVETNIQNEDDCFHDLTDEDLLFLLQLLKDIGWNFHKPVDTTNKSPEIAFAANA